MCRFKNLDAFQGPNGSVRMDSLRAHLPKLMNAADHDLVADKWLSTLFRFISNEPDDGMYPPITKETHLQTIGFRPNHGG